MEGHHQMGHDNRGDYNCDNFYGDKTFSTFRSGGYNKPCYANGRCQSRQKAALVRQASAGSLPPDHHRGSYVGDVVGGRGASSAYNLQHAAEDLGYKSDGEGYKSDGGGCYRGCASAGPHSFRNQPYPQPIQSRPQEYYNQVSISPSFCTELFHSKVFFVAFIYLQFAFAIFLANGKWQKCCS